MEEFTHEFYQLSICVDHHETNEQLAARYVKCLKFSIQYELRMHSVRSVEESYQLSLKAEEKKPDNLLKGIEEQGGVHCLPHGVVLIMEEANHPKELKKKKILDKVT